LTTPPGLVPLPIDAHLPAILEALEGQGCLVLGAEPGAGKTTRVPRALLDAGLLEAGECWVLEPRRLAARLAAARVAAELGEPLGRTVGYAVRFEQKVSRATRVRFVTEGLLLRRLQADPMLRGIGTVLLDEFHERHLQTDLAISLLHRLRKGPRPDLRLAVMSATLDADPVAAFLGAPIIRCPGRPWPVEVRHLPRPDTRPLETQVAEAVDRLYRDGLKGHTLVFLPGAAEIRKGLRACARAAEVHGFRLLPLHGSLGFEAQQEAVAPSERFKVILSTNVAESSVTLEGVAAVVDSGLGKEAFHSPWSGLPGLRTARISQARCLQRTGRAGRTGPGLCLRLFTLPELNARPPYDQPELRRTDLAEPLLALADLGLVGADLAWFEAPPAQALASAANLLERLGALDARGAITTLGRRCAALPLHPRLARLVTAGEDLGIPHLARLGAVLLETGDLGARTGISSRGGSSPKHALESDLLARLDQFLDPADTDPAALRQARLAFKALGDGPLEGDEESLLRALVAAYPDRIAKVGGNGTCTLVGGGGARLAPQCRVQRAAWILALEAENVGGQVLVQAASRLEPDWLLDAFPDSVRDTEELLFNAGTGRVDLHARLWFEDLILLESRRPAPPGHPGAAQVLARAAAGFELPLDALLARAAFLARHRPELGIPPSPDLGAAILAQACEGLVRLKDLEAADWPSAARRALGPEAARLLDAWAPEWVQLKPRRVRVNYGGEAPWIEARLQDFLGLKEGPRIAGGSVPLVLHLLAPNKRAVQVTTDLAGFWQRAYKELRGQLSRRYPKHHWPEDPA
jgi:ATP-dependent helicase HrpB